MVNIMVALEIGLSHKHIHFAVDNGKWLAIYFKNIWLITSTYDITMTVTHIAGRKNTIADLLSRWDKTQNNTTKLGELVRNADWQQVPENMFDVNLEI